MQEREVDEPQHGIIMKSLGIDEGAPGDKVKEAYRNWRSNTIRTETPGTPAPWRG